MTQIRYKAIKRIPPEIQATTPDAINFYSTYLIKSVSNEICDHIIKKISPSVMFNGLEFTIAVDIDSTLIPLIKVNKSIIDEISYKVIKDIRSGIIANNKPKRRRVICPETGRPIWKK